MPEKYSGREVGKKNLRSRDKWGKYGGKCLFVVKRESENMGVVRMKIPRE